VNGRWALGMKWREVESSPLTGKLSARPAGKPGDFLIAKESLRRSLPRHPFSRLQRTILRALSMRFPGMAESIGPMWFPNQNQKPKQNQTLGWDRTASRWSAPSPGKRTRREDHALLIVRDEFRTGYSLIGLLASIARLRFPGRRRLTCAPHRPRLKGTFLLCPEGDISTLP
jgi:hypothetical protein